MIYKRYIKVKIRRADILDLFDLMKIEKEVFGNDSNKLKLWDFFVYVMKKNIYIAYNPYETVGYLAHDAVGYKSAYVESLAILPDYRRVGAGRLLLMNLQKIYDEVKLHVHDKNPAVRFYKSMDFEETAVIPDFYEYGPAIEMVWHK